VGERRESPVTASMSDHRVWPPRIGATELRLTLVSFHRSIGGRGDRTFEPCEVVEEDARVEQSVARVPNHELERDALAGLNRRMRREPSRRAPVRALRAASAKGSAPRALDPEARTAELVITPGQADVPGVKLAAHPVGTLGVQRSKNALFTLTGLLLLSKDMLSGWPLLKPLADRNAMNPSLYSEQTKSGHSPEWKLKSN
jgi:hypothetical protein